MRHFVIRFLFLIFCTGPALGHEGHGIPRVLVDVIKTVHHANDVEIELRMTNLDSVLVLDEARVEGAVVIGEGPAEFRFAEDLVRRYRVMFSKEVPGVFTLWLDFGHAGIGQVAIFPETQGDPNE